jgi:hypothetical protein
MNFFERFNSKNGTGGRSGYRKISDIDPFMPMALRRIEKFTTVNGPTTKVNCILNNEDIFFFMGNADHIKLQDRDYDDLMELVNSNAAPFIVVVQTRFRRQTLILPFSEYFTCVMFACLVVLCCNSLYKFNFYRC